MKLLRLSVLTRTSISFSVAVFVFVGCGPMNAKDISTELSSSQTANGSQTAPPGTSVQPPPLNTNPSYLEELTYLSQWNETVTWSQFNSKLMLNWQRSGSDWLDAKGVTNGPEAYVSVKLVDDNLPNAVEMDVTALVQSTGKADFLMRRSGGDNYNFHSRETDKGPKLILDGTTVLEAVADATLSPSSSGSYGKEVTLKTASGFLVRFDLPSVVMPQKVILRLE